MKLEGLDKFLTEYPGMSLKPRRNVETKIQGHFEFRATGFDRATEDDFELEILVNKAFPNSIPEFKETGGKIPRISDYHVNPDGTLCLGSHLRLKRILFETPNFNSFIEKCLVPYLFNVSVKLRHGGKFVTGELAHGTEGIIQDYKDLLGLRSPDQIVNALYLLGMRRRVANKKMCPCNCGLLLGRCAFHNRLNIYRPIASRSWFSKHATEIEERRVR